MTGRGIDQVLPHPGDPTLHEPYVSDARDYVAFAEEVSGPLTAPLPLDWIWGDALAIWEELSVDARIVNLETSVTTSDHWLPKGINYRMHPANVGCLTAGRIDVCTLANNHVLDWGAAGLVETLDTLHAAGLKTAGAGRDLAEAEAPAVVDASSGARVLVFALGSPTSGVPIEWSAGWRKAGVAWFEERSLAAVDAVGARIATLRRPRDVVVMSVHWGDNWGWEIPKEQIAFAHALVDRAGVDVVFGHSSHHPKGIEVFHDRLVLYGCGDLIDDYEGIRGHEEFMSDRVLSYVAHLDETTGRLAQLAIVPFRLKQLRLARPDAGDVRWLRAMLEREGRRFGTRVDQDRRGLVLRWN